MGDEIFPETWDMNAPIDARGYLHVIDVSDIENPVEVAKYEVPEAGAHNIWIEDDEGVVLRMFMFHFLRGAVESQIVFEDTPWYRATTGSGPTSG